MIVIETRLLTESEWAEFCQFPEETDREYFEGFAAHLNSQSLIREYRVQPETDPEPPNPDEPTTAGFRVDVHLDFPLAAWASLYGGAPTEQGVSDWLTSALFVGSDQVAASVNAVIPDDEESLISQAVAEGYERAGREHEVH